MDKYILECCVDSVESAIQSEIGGANRLELCSNLIIEGTTPSIKLFEEVRKNVSLKINVLIRPRFGDFLYSDYEFEIIKNEVSMFRSAGADGVVIGCLNKDGSLDIKRMEKLIKEGEGMNFTLHRAFDLCSEPFKALEQAKKLGIDSILTSGQRNNCLEGKDLISKLIKRSENKVNILIGGGVCDNVIIKMMDEMDASCFHMSGKVLIDSSMEYRNEMVNMGLQCFSEYSIYRTDKNEISKAKDAIIKKLIEKKIYKKA